MGQPLYCSAADAGIWKERADMVMAPPPMCDSAVLPCFHGCLAFLHRHFPPQSPQSISPQSTASLNSSCSRCPFQETRVPAQHMYGCSKDCLILVPFRLPQISCFTLSLKCFSSDSDSCPPVGVGPLLQFPHPPRVGPVLLTLQFLPLVPSSYQVLRGSIYSFPLVRSSCQLSAGVLHALLCLKVYS